MGEAEGSLPHFSRAAVLGIGLIGASFALAGKAAGLLDRVVGVARREETRRAALAIGAADEATDDPLAAVRDADLVYLATPVGVMPGLLAALGPAIAPGCLVTDAGSVKAPVCLAATRSLRTGASFVGGHPMAGSERSGPEAARADLFRGHTYFVVPTPLGGAPAADRLTAVVRAIGGEPVAVEAAEHDRILAITSHLPHAAAMALMLAVEELLPGAAQRRSLSGAGLRDTTRIAGGSPEMWRDVFLANAGPLAEACGLAAARLEALGAMIAAGDAEGLLDALADARAARRSLDATEEGGG